MTQVGWFILAAMMVILGGGLWAHAYFSEKRQERLHPQRSTRTVDMGDDPLNPHGDNTLREGDPLFDMLMNGGGVLFAKRNDDGTWDVEQKDERHPNS